MIIGFALTISLTVLLTSLIVVISGLSGTLQESIITGGVIGTGRAVSYAIIALLISITTTLWIVLHLRKKKS
jgi:hypothetical protein